MASSAGASSAGVPTVVDAKDGVIAIENKVKAKVVIFFIVSSPLLKLLIVLLYLKEEKKKIFPLSPL
jgi:hypothetical protein